MKNRKHFISLFFIALFLLFKVAGLHVLSHDVDDLDIEHCEVCHITISANFTPILGTNTTIVPQKQYLLSEQKLLSLVPYFIYSDQLLSSYLFARPPPSRI